MLAISDLIASNQRRWTVMKVTGNLTALIDVTAKKLTDVTAKTRYQAVSQTTTVPWYIIAVIHEREASQSWKANISQGDPWNKVSIHVPKGRGPFASWEDAAVDALTNCAPLAAKWKNWTPGGALTLLEEYNGLGYAAREKPSPYIWASTDQYIKGKYIADGHYDPNAVDHQLGCAAILNRMMALDNTIVFSTT